MPTINGWLTPDTIPTDKVCRVLRIPAEYEYIVPAVMGALLPLTQSENWEMFGSVTPAQMAAAMMQMYFDIVNVDCVTNIVGEIKMMGNASLPAGWLYCNGEEVAKATYPELWNAITDFWGVAVNPTDNFVLPDLRNKFPIGFAQGGGAPAIGTYGGEATHVLTTAEIPAHNHALESTLTGSSTTHLIWSGAFGNDTPAAYKTYDAGGGGAHNNIPPYGAVSYIIYAGA